MAEKTGKTIGELREEVSAGAVSFDMIRESLVAATGEGGRFNGMMEKQSQTLLGQFSTLKDGIAGLSGKIFLPLTDSLTKDVMPAINSFLDMANKFDFEGMFAGLGIGASKVEKIFQGMEKTGTVTAESVKKMVEAGFDPIAEMSKRTGKSIEQLNAELANGIMTIDDMSKSIDNVPKVNWAEKIMTGFDDTIDNISVKLGLPLETVANLKMAFADLWGSAASGGQQLADTFSGFSQIGEDFQLFIADDLIPAVAGMLPDMIGIFTDMSNSIANIFSDIANYVIPILDGFVNEALPFLTEFAADSVTAFRAIFDMATDIFDKLWNVAIKPAMDLIADIVVGGLTLIREFWDEWGDAIYDNVVQVFENIKGVFDGVIAFVQPIWETFIAGLSQFWDEHLSGMVDKLLDFVGELLSGGSAIKSDFVDPVIDAIEEFRPVFAAAFDYMQGQALIFLEIFQDVCGGIVDAAGGLLDFFAGVFTGDMDKAMTGLGEIFEGIGDMVLGALRGMLNGLIETLNLAIKAVNKLQFEVPKWVPEIGGEKFGANIKQLSKVESGEASAKLKQPKPSKEQEKAQKKQLKEQKNAALDIAKMVSGAAGEPAKPEKEERPPNIAPVTKTAAPVKDKKAAKAEEKAARDKKKAEEKAARDILKADEKQRKAEEKAAEDVATLQEKAQEDAEKRQEKIDDLEAKRQEVAAKTDADIAELREKHAEKESDIREDIAQQEAKRATGDKKAVERLADLQDKLNDENRDFQKNLQKLEDKKNKSNKDINDDLANIEKDKLKADKQMNKDLIEATNGTKVAPSLQPIELSGDSISKMTKSQDGVMSQRNKEMIAQLHARSNDLSTKFLDLLKPANAKPDEKQPEILKPKTDNLMPDLKSGIGNMLQGLTPEKPQVKLDRVDVPALTELKTATAAQTGLMGMLPMSLAESLKSVLKPTLDAMTATIAFPVRPAWVDELPAIITNAVILGQQMLDESRPKVDTERPAVFLMDGVEVARGTIPYFRDEIERTGGKFTG